MTTPEPMPASTSNQGLAGRMAAGFVDSKLTPLLVIASVLLGLFAVLMLPREEEPQIKVPMVDVIVRSPGMSAQEIERQIGAPMEKLIWEVSGVEYLYSSSRPGEAMTVVRFAVGEDVERSLVKLNQKLEANFDRIPFGAERPILKPRSIDDVPILALTFHSPIEDHFALRRVVSEVQEQIKQVPDVSETVLIGGLRRQLRVQLSPTALTARGLDIGTIMSHLQAANFQLRAGELIAQREQIIVQTDGFLAPEMIGTVIVGTHSGRPVYLRDVAEILDGPEELNQVVIFGSGAGADSVRTDEAAVTLTIAKRPGTNASSVAHAVLGKIDAIRDRMLPGSIDMTVTRNYGETATEKSDELLVHMLIAVLSVSLLILLSLGWRESIIVALAIPSTLALTLLVFYLAGFTLNRITLFALIFSIGILVDDAIVVVENITRHLALPYNKGRSWRDVAIDAVAEVGNPTILATWAVIAAVFPMAFVGGLMGPYMRPIPLGATAAMLFSLVVAFIVTPWAAVRVLAWKSAGGSHVGHGEGREGLATRVYRQLMRGLITRRGNRNLFFGAVLLAMLIAIGTVGIGWVQVKMLPFDNKNELQIILNMPEGTTLEETTEAARSIARSIAQEPEVTDYQIYAGTSAPYNFNGLVRHYFLRRGANVADIQVNLIDKSRRTAQSHDIARRIRPAIAAVASDFGASAAVAEVPPGPPVLQTLVAEVYGPDDSLRQALAREVQRIFHSTDGVVDVDSYLEEDRQTKTFVIDHQKAALLGISARQISTALRAAVSGSVVGLVHLPAEREQTELVVEFARRDKATVDNLLSIPLQLPRLDPTAAQKTIALAECVTVIETPEEPTRYRKNLMPVTYVIGDVAGTIESPYYAIAEMNKQLEALDMTQFGGTTASLEILNASHPTNNLEPALKWDGEWHITLEVFRDLGIAFAAVLILIYMLMVGWFKSLLTPLIVMAAIPFSLIGILPAHGLLSAFFTATSMIGFMAGAGIVIRNSIILVDFIELRVAQGMPLDEAVIDAGAVRFRPMLLTAGAVIVGAAVILFDPIFQGLAISLMAGEVASLLVSRVAVPVLYFLANSGRSNSIRPERQMLTS